MSGYTVLCDNSGSTGNVAAYWAHVESIIGTRDIENYVFWNDTRNPKSISKADFLSAVRRKIGTGGTASSLVAEYLLKNKINNYIIIITDGQVDPSEVTRCDQILKEWHIDYVECHIIGNEQYMNMSVTCPLTRNNNSKVFVNGKLYSSHSKEDYLILDTIDTITLHDFLSSYSKLETLLISRNMGKTGDLAMHGTLTELKKRLVREISEITTGEDDTPALLTEAVRSANYSLATSLARAMSDKYFDESSKISPVMNIIKKCDYLISLCGNLGSLYTIDAIRRAKMVSAPTVVAPTVTPSTDQVEADDFIECPISFDDDVATILIVEGEPILNTLDKKVRDAIEQNPLCIVNYPEVVARLKARIGHHVGLNTSEELSACPYTRQPICGVFPLGNSDIHVKYSNNQLAKLMTGTNKLIGNVQLYYVALWYLVETDKIEYLNDIKSVMSNHLKYRLTNSVTRACLSGMPQFVLTKVPTDIVFWFILTSALFDHPTDRDALRFHIFVMDVIVKVVNVLEYQYDSRIEKQILRTKTLLTMLTYVKNDKITFRNKITALYQNAICIDKANVDPDIALKETVVQYIPIDGKASDEQVCAVLDTFPEYFKELSIDELVSIANLVDPSKSASAIPLPMSWQPTHYEHKIEWSYGLNIICSGPHLINPESFRPYYAVIDTDIGKKVHSAILAEKIFGYPVNKQMSAYRKYVDYYMKYHKFPINLESYLTFCYNRYCVNGHSCHTTLPYPVKSFYDDTTASYEPIVQLIKDNGMTVEQVLAVLNTPLPQAVLHSVTQ